MRPRRRRGVETNTGAAAPAAAHHCHAHARTYQHEHRGWPCSCGCRGHRKRAGCSWRNAQGWRISLSLPGTAGGSSRLCVGCGERPHAPHDTGCRCRCSAVREIVLAWPLPYAWNKLNWIFQFSFYEDNQDKGNN